MLIAIRRLRPPYLRRRPPTSRRAFIALHSLALRRPPTALVPFRRPPPTSRRPSPSSSWSFPSSVGGDSGIAASVGVAPAAGEDPTRRRRPPYPPPPSRSDNTAGVVALVAMAPSATSRWRHRRPRLVWGASDMTAASYI